MSVKIQINSLEALERLIGGDSALEIKLRNSIVQDFTKRHLKALATDNLLLQMQRTIQEEVKKEFFENVKSGSYGGTRSVLKKEVLDELKEQLKYEANRQLREVVQELIDFNKTNEEITKALDYSTGVILTELQSSVLEKRLNAMVDKKIKEKLGL